MRLDRVVQVALMSRVGAAFYPVSPPQAAAGWAAGWDAGRAAGGAGDGASDGGVTVGLRRRENKYGIVYSKAPSQPKSMAVDQDGTDYSYFATVKFGTSARLYHMLIDTGAANTWVMADACTTDACNSHDRLGPTESTSLTVLDDPFSMVYGTGSISGTLAHDTAHFAGFNVPLTFGLPTNVSAEFLSYAIDGILGLGRPGLTSAGTSAVLDSLRDAGAIAARRFGVHLPRQADGAADGELNFGALNPALYDGEVGYSSVVPGAAFWEVAVDDAGVDGAALGLPARTAIIDTGTSFVLMPEPDASALHARIAGSARAGDRFHLPCDTAQLVQVAFAGTAYAVAPRDYVGPVVDGSAGALCASNILPRQTFADTQWLVGQVFLKNVYAVFDQDGGRVGFARRKGESALELSSLAPASSTAAPVSSTGSSSADAIGSAAPSTSSAHRLSKLFCTNTYPAVLSSTATDTAHSYDAFFASGYPPTPARPASEAALAAAASPYQANLSGPTQYSLPSATSAAAQSAAPTALVSAGAVAHARLRRACTACLAALLASLYAI